MSIGQFQKLAATLGLQPQLRADGDISVECSEGNFLQHLTALLESTVLSDLFASTPGDGPASLTAVLQMEGESSWLLVHTQLAQPRFPSLTAVVHAASWYEREIYEMHGLEPVGHPAPARLRLHEWPSENHPMRDAPPSGYDMLSHPLHVPQHPRVTGQGVFALPLGPVRSGAQESAQFLFSSGGEDIVAVDMQLGFKFRAIERLAVGQSADRAIHLAERVAGTSSFANGLAFTRAVERAVGADVAPVVEHARSLLGEVERLYSHFGTISRLAEATGLLVAAAQYGILKEEALRAAGRLTGNRYLRGALQPGGMTLLPSPEARDWLAAQVETWSSRTDRLRRLLEDTSTFVDRLETTAVLDHEYAVAHNLVGPVGRASGIDRDVRRDHPYAAYGAVKFQVPTATEGDAEARFRVHIAELEQSLSILSQLLSSWPASTDQQAPLALHAGAALGWAEAPGGETLHFVILDEAGAVVRWRARPPAAVNWHPYAHACSSGNNLTDYPVIEASFSLSHAEFDR